MVSAQVLLRKKVEKSAVYGAVIAILAILIATLLTSYLTHGIISSDAVIHVQQTNMALWVLDVMPFFFMFWGQYTGTMLVEGADSLLVEKEGEIKARERGVEEKIKKGATYDILTGLPNMEQFLVKLGTVIQDKTAHGDTKQVSKDGLEQTYPLAIILFDIDNFREINNTLGSQNGDVILKSISTRLKRAFKGFGVVIARVGGDDFALFQVNKSESETIKVTNKVRDLFEKPYDINGISVMLDISIGISTYPEHGDNPKDLLQHAEVAMYACKKQAQPYAFYNQKLNMHDVNDLILKNEIRRAFDNDELSLHYQPKVNVDNQVHEVEALVRWNHPEKGLIPPDTFIPMIIRKRLNNELLQRILELALQQAKIWEKEGIHLRIALNLTAFDLLEPDLPKMIADKLAKYNLSTDVLKLEITETTLVENQALTLETLVSLSDMGIPTSIDDFGTGYSSLAYLSSLPIKEIKIDRSFVLGMMDNDKDGKIVQAIIALAHSLSLYTVAEGVEDIETLEKLRGIQCDSIQGYYFSRPLEGQAFTSWIKAWHEDNTGKQHVG